jgi:hypothetical protein
MKKLFVIFSLIFINFYEINAQLAKSNIKVGYEFFDQIVRVATKKVLDEVNKKKTGLPDFDMNFNLAKFIPINASVKNFSYSEIPFVENQFSIEHVTEDLVSIKLSKIIVNF